MEQNLDSSNNKYNASYESHSGVKYHPQRERGGLIPVTANIIKNAEITQDETVEFQGVNIIDITLVGYIVDYKENDNKIIITLYDYTGLIDIHFYIRQENDDAILDNFKYEGKREPVQIFGTVKVDKGKKDKNEEKDEKNEKIILGAKLIKSNCNYVLYHRANVIHSFLYLTGKIKEKNVSGGIFSSGNNKNENMRIIYPSSSNKKKGYDDMEEAVNILSEYAKKENQIKTGKLEELFKKFGNKSKDIINQLISDNKLIDNDDYYEIIC